jgi:hypothetical protein
MRGGSGGSPCALVAGKRACRPAAPAGWWDASRRRPLERLQKRPWLANAFDSRSPGPRTRRTAVPANHVCRPPPPAGRRGRSE